MGAFGVALDREAALEGICDEAETLFGIRTVTADAVHGLQVNGRTVKLKGGSIMTTACLGRCPCGTANTGSWAC